jgi:hypothetical protein
MELMRIKKSVASLALAGTMFGATVVGVGAQHVTQVGQNGARGVIAAVVTALQNVNVTDNNVDVAVVELNNSLNNLTALNNVLNNNNILQGFTIQDVSVLSANQIDILRNANINIGEVVGVAILSGGDFLVFTR